jgi:capping protein (actin filament) muscle Z-line, alpha
MQATEEAPKSPKSPKLSEEICEMTLSSSEEINETSESEKSENNIKSLHVLKEIIQNCPAGQTQEVASLCRDLFVGHDDLIDQEVQEKLEKDSFILKTTKGKEDEVVEEEKEEEEKVISTEEEEKEEEVISAEEEKVISDFKSELSKKLQVYVKELYPEAGSFMIERSAEDLNIFKIHILCQKLRPKTFWSGHWHSTWTVEFKEQGAFSMKGSVDLTVHYHEEGSVQLSASKDDIQSRVDMKYENLIQAADKAYWKIRDSEDSVQVALNEAYQQLSETIFKKLRRQLPVTRTKMDWTKFSDYNLSNELKK